MKKQMVFGVLMGMCLLGIHGVAVAAPIYGVFMVTKGQVKVENPKTGTTDAKVGLKIFEGDTVITAADSRAKIVMSDRNVINVNPDTKLQIAKYQNDEASGKKNVELNLLQGKVRNNVEQVYDGEKSKFLIKTPTAVAGVRGTQFMTSYNPSTQLTSVVTFKGAVALASVNLQGAIIGAPVIIKKGEMTTSTPNAAPEPPRVLPKDEVKKMDVETAAVSTPPSPKEPGGSSVREIASEKKDDGKKRPDKGPIPTMIDKRDLDVGMAREIVDPKGGPAPLPMQPMPRAPGSDNTTVKDLIRDNMGKTRVNIKPQVGP